MVRRDDCNHIAYMAIMLASIGFGLMALYDDRVFLGATLVFLGIFVYEDSKGA